MEDTKIKHISRTDLKIQLRDIFRAFAKESLHRGFHKRFQGLNSKLPFPFTTIPIASKAKWKRRNSKATEALTLNHNEALLLVKARNKKIQMET